VRQRLTWIPGWWGRPVTLVECASGRRHREWAVKTCNSRQLRKSFWLLEMCTDNVAVDDTNFLVVCDGTTPTSNFVRPRLV